MTSKILLDRLVKNYGMLFENSVKNYDMIIKCGDKHLYIGEVTLDELYLLELLDLLSATDEFMLSELMEFTESFLISLAETWMKTNFIKIHLHAHKFTGCKILQEFCIKKICANPDLIFMPKDYSNLNEEVLINLLKRDDLEMEEIKLWKYIIQWGIHKCSSDIDHDSNLNETDVSEWNETNFKELWEVLKNFIDFIRFCNISVEVFEKEVQPLSEMFPRKIYEKILWNYIKPQKFKILKRGHRWETGY
ncbi:13831_t:CDS:2 [Funneliformis geosporum]|uniref:13831_t:CDS:1 n=1 Tax=Funneliformis geosporum TaxID=1117311 RepID=A0A9W4SAM6_9GLOM|nr:13831_t:CDS:2 [Funneliformis geosporum]